MDDIQRMVDEIAGRATGDRAAAERAVHLASFEGNMTEAARGWLTANRDPGIAALWHDPVLTQQIGQAARLLVERALTGQGG